MGQDVAAAGGVSILLGVVKNKEASDATVGNAALCLADSAADNTVLAQLAKADAVAPLIEVLQIICSFRV